MSETLQKTPLYDNHVKLGARMVPFAGFEMPVQYSGVIEETKAVRATGGLFDVSHMGQFRLKGKNVIDAVQRLVTNDLSKLAIGKAQYNAICYENGGTIDDLVIYKIGETELYICVNASNRERDFEWFKKHLDHTISLVDESDDTALLALQGPNAEKLLFENGDRKVIEAIPYYGGTTATVFGTQIFLARTGYTGEDGFELYIPKEQASRIWDEILEKGKKHGILPIGLGARDTLRMEMGYALYGHELNENTSPIAAGQGWIVKVDKATPFIGQKALQKEKVDGPAKKLMAFILEDKRIARQGYPILNEAGETVGEIVSGTHSPHLGKPIALGFVKKEHAGKDKYLIAIRKDQVPAFKAKLPFVPSKVKK